MPDSCCAPGCQNRRVKGQNIPFYRIPSTRNMELREKWLSKIKREQWSDDQIDKARLCGSHFVSGKY